MAWGWSALALIALYAARSLAKKHEAWLDRNGLEIFLYPGIVIVLIGLMFLIVVTNS